MANGRDVQHCLGSMDSDLEAFSRNPTYDSFAVLAFQLTAFTKYQPVSRWSKPSLRSLLAGEQSDTLGLLRLNDMKNRHRRIKKQRRYDARTLASVCCNMCSKDN